MSVAATACPSEDELRRFIDGTMTGETRALCRAHIRTCDRCRPIVLAALQTAPLDDTEPTAHTLPSERQAGRYRLTGVLGAGAMGVVYTAFDPELGRKLAVKLVRARATDEQAEERRRRFVREGRNLARVVHPNVVAIYDVGSIDDDIFIAMELVSGGTLRDWLQRGEHSVDQTLALFDDIGRGLNAVHKAGMVHRDFKPENVLIDADGRPRVTDFGLAQAELGDPTPALGTTLPEQRASSARGRTLSMTQTGALLGTPAYMAPEQLRGEPVDARADVFAFAVVLWEALFGYRPFAGSSVEELERNIRAERFVRPSARHSRLRAVETVLQRALRANVALRTPTLDALLDELHRLRQPPPKHGRVAAALVAVLLSGATVSGLAVWRARESSRCQQRPFVASWQQQLRSRLVERFAQMAATAPAMRALGEHIVNNLDQYNGALDTTQRTVCEATYVKRLKSERIFDAQMACLRRLHDRFELLAQSLADEPEIPINAAELTPRLHPPDECLEAMPRGDRKGDLSRYEVVARMLATAQTQQMLSHFQQANETFVGAQAAAEQLNERDLVAEAQLGRAQSELNLGRIDRARLLLDEGIANALLEHDARLAHGGYVLSVRIAQHLDAPIEEAERAVQLFHWLTRRNPSGSFHEPQLLAAMGSIYLRFGKPEKAMDTLRAGLALPNVTIEARFSLGQALGELYVDKERFDEADVTLRFAWIDAAAAYGIDSALPLAVEMSQVFLAYSRHGAKAALPLQEHVVQQLERFGEEQPQRLVDALQNLSVYLSAVDRDADAFVASERAMRLAQKKLESTNASRVAAELSYASSLVDLHREAEARAILDALLPRIDPTDRVDGPMISHNALALRSTLVNAYRRHDKAIARHHLARVRTLAEPNRTRADVKAVLEEMDRIDKELGPGDGK